MLKDFLGDLFNSAFQHNQKNILDSLNSQKIDNLLDLGCDDGTWLTELNSTVKANQVTGVELIEERARLATQKGIKVHVGDLNQPLPFADESFDLIHANQVIEHLSDIDHFASEIYRLLKPSGRAIVSTENGSSWHNIFASMMGWQTFSLTNLSKLRAGVGNPMALLRNQKIEQSTWTHKVIFNYQGFKEFFELHNFKVLEIKGAGYYPLPTKIADWDPRHAHFITAILKK